MTAPARVVATIRPDTVFVPFHWVGANRLTNDALDPSSRMPEFKVCAAAVERMIDGMRERLVVVGNGMAATRLVEELCSRGYDGQVTVLGDEDHAPYNRILLSRGPRGQPPPRAIDAARGRVVRRPGRRPAPRLPGARDRPRPPRGDAGRRRADRLRPAGAGHRRIPTLPPIRGLVRMDGPLHPKVHAFRTLADCDRPRRRGRVPAARSGRSSSAAACSASRSPGRSRCAAWRPRSSRAPRTCWPRQLGAAGGRVLARDLRRLGTEVYTGTRAVR